MKLIGRAALGFSVVEGLLVVVLIGLVGAVGYRAYTARHQKASQASENTAKKTAASAAPVLSAAEATPAPKVESNNDLDAALKALDDVNPDASAADDAQLGTQATF